MSHCFLMANRCRPADRIRRCNWSLRLGDRLRFWWPGDHRHGRYGVVSRTGEWDPFEAGRESSWVRIVSPTPEDMAETAWSHAGPGSVEYGECNRDWRLPFAWLWPEEWDEMEATNG